MWHPWKTAAERFSHITIVTAHRLPRGVRGLFEGNTIWLCSTLTQAERRCALTHELQHAERGVPADPFLPREEQIVDELAARRLVPIENLARALRATRDTDSLAEELWVDRHTIQVRMRTLDPIETAALEHEFGDEWLWIP
ncbi:hypothetical protein [Mycolicibacterium peregrinum]|uniref:hypothetical protein n=1 Tax=Mycolicibacterium peregrinum TaxID=43304 RepID=UPI003AAEF61D